MASPPFEFFPKPTTPENQIKSILQGKSPYFYLLPPSVQLLIDHESKSYDQILATCRNVYETTPSSITGGHTAPQKELLAHETLGKILTQDKTFSNVRTAIIAATGAGTTPAVTISVCHILVTLASGDMDCGKALTMLNSHTPLIMCLTNSYNSLQECDTHLRPLLASVFPPENVIVAISKFSLSVAKVLQELMTFPGWEKDSTPIQYLVEYGDEDADSVSTIADYYFNLMGNYAQHVRATAANTTPPELHTQLQALNDLNAIVTVHTKSRFKDVVDGAGNE
jgi:hypothetical protein